MSLREKPLTYPFKLPPPPRWADRGMYFRAMLFNFISVDDS